jgi:hypothetical protein
MNTLWKTLFTLWISALPLEVFSANSLVGTKCGIYEIYGVVRIKNDTPVLRIFEKSISEATLSLDSDLKATLLPYKDKSIILKARLTAPLKNQEGALGTLKTFKDDLLFTDEVKERVSDPLYPMKDSKMTLLKELPCSKKD